jgi:hypothetical protein
MKIREANLTDREQWDSFVDTQDGIFQHYFNWKFATENSATKYIQLVIESDSSELIGIFPIIKVHRALYSKLNSISGLLLKKDISAEEKYQTTLAALKYVEVHYGKNCSRFFLDEHIHPGSGEERDPDPALTELGFRSRYDRKTHLPCKHILELNPPFKENIWMGLWSQKFRQALRKVEKNGVSVIEDSEMGYVEEFVDMLMSNYKRHNIKIPARTELLDQMKMQIQYFKGKLKLYVALLENKPIVILYCSYTASTCQLEGVGAYTKGTDDANKLCYKVAIEKACDAGYKFADFGGTYTTSLASLKERYGAGRIPIMRYEKRYSFARMMIELAPEIAGELWRKRSKVWSNRRHYWKVITRR